MKTNKERTYQDGLRKAISVALEHDTPERRYWGEQIAGEIEKHLKED